MKIAVLGGAGFIGVSIVKSLLLSGVEVFVLDREDRLQRVELILDGAHFVTIKYPNLNGIDAVLPHVDCLVQLASTTHPASSMKSMSFDIETNVLSTVKLLEAAEKTGLKKMVFASSGGAIYGAPTSLPVHEDMRCQPLSVYGVTKLSIENYLSLSSTVNCISLRIANPYGAYQLKGAKVGLIAAFMNSIKNGHALEVWGDGSVIRDYLYIDDVVEAVNLVCFSEDIQQGAYNIGSGVGYSVRDIINALAQIMDKEPVVRYMASRAFDVPEIVLDASKIREAIPWKPRFCLNDGIEQMLMLADSR